VGAGFRVLGEGDLDTLASPFRAIERNRSRGRALRHGRASNGWNDESVLPDDDEGPEACPQNR